METPKIVKLLILLEAILGIIALAVAIPILYVTNRSADPELSYYAPIEIEDDLSNSPLTGLCPPADQLVVPPLIKMVFVPVIWRIIEPIRGQYDWEYLEEKYQFKRWTDRGVKFVFRVQLDVPSEVTHIDIPDWLFELTNHDGYFYDSPLIGKGYSPNYANLVFIEEHEKFIKAFANRYANYNRTLVIQIGSIGHYGEWNNFPYPSTGIFPFHNVSIKYVDHYKKYFPNSILQIPRPVNDTANVGLYFKGLGDRFETELFIRRFTGHSYLDDIGQVQLGSSDFWKFAPSSAEFPFSSSTEFLSDSNIESTIQQATLSYVSFIGPTYPSEITESHPYWGNFNKLLKSTGYRFFIQDFSYPSTISIGDTLKIYLTVINRGPAPFYLNWPLEVYLTSNLSSGYSVRTKEDLQTWVGTRSVTLKIPLTSEIEAGKYDVCIAILDPLTGTPGVDLAIQGKAADGRYCFGFVNIEEDTKLNGTEIALAGIAIVGITIVMVVVTYFAWRIPADCDKDAKAEKENQAKQASSKPTVDTGGDVAPAESIVPVTKKAGKKGKSWGKGKGKAKGVVYL